MIPDYYAILKISPSASTAEIKRAYRHLVRLHHPDLNAQAQDEEIKRLNEAYAVLSAARKRSAYDELRQQARERAEAEAERRAQEEAAREPKMTWAQGAAGFVRELKAEAGMTPRAQEEAKSEPKLTWAQGVAGFMRELKKEMKDS